jgi:protein involved in polysaccharide export with SLBB domain
MHHWKVLLSLVLLMASACAPTASSFQHSPESIAMEDALKASAGSLGPGDVFEVRVYNESSLTGVYRVTPEGTIDFPLVGAVQVIGLSPNAVEKAIRGALQKGFIRNPHVTVYVKEYNSKKIFVLGEVHRPGTFVFQDNMTVVQAVTMAGGFRPTAFKDGTIVTRIAQGKERRIPVPVASISSGRAANFSLLPGDIIFVPESLL